MKNYEIVAIFYHIADILELKEVAWKPRAYRQVAQTIETLGHPIEDIYEDKGIKGLLEIPGVGKHIAAEIEQYIRTGKIKEYNKLRKEVPIKFEELSAIESLGPKKIKVLYKKLKVKTVAQLEKVAKQHKIAKLPGFSDKTEENILLGIQRFKAGKGRILLAEALPVAREIIEHLKKLKEINQISEAGSVRRRREDIGDLDILVTTKKPSKVMDYFVKMPQVKRVLVKGTTKSTIITKENINVDLRIVKPSEFGSAMQYFVGSKYHNIELRKIAIKKGYKLSEYGLFSKTGAEQSSARRSGKSSASETWKRVAGKTEQEIYKKLGMQLPEPELRENRGEIQAALKKKLPKLVELKDIKGDFQMHTKWSDGTATIEAMAKAARELGRKYICITDHSKTRAIAHGLDEKKVLKQIKEIKKVDKKINGIKVLAGIEVDILGDGSLDLNKKTLEKLDIVVAAIHSGLKQPKEKITNRIVKAIESGVVDIIAHPTGRIILGREGSKLDLDKIFKAAKKHKVIMEIDAYPTRLDLNDNNIKKAIYDYGLKLSIDTDAHTTDQLNMMEYGVYTARRGWARKQDIVNTRPYSQLKKFFKKL